MGSIRDHDKFAIDSVLTHIVTLSVAASGQEVLRAAHRTTSAGREPVLRREFKPRSSGFRGGYLLMLRFGNAPEIRCGLRISESAADLGVTKVAVTIIVKA
jgi:hypothetical protein